jgi:hypothetical protein
LKAKRSGLIAMLLVGGALNAHVDNDVHDNTSTRPCGEADISYCCRSPIGGITGSSCSNFEAKR